MRNRLIAPSVGFLVLLVVGADVVAALPAVSTNVRGVTVTATPDTLSGGIWEFQVAFNTHTQDLQDDVVKSATLVADGAASAPLEWRGDPPGGHHRKGLLRFKAPAARPAAIELRLSRPGEVEPRVFRWKLE